MQQDFQDLQDSQDFLSPSEQDQAILLYRVGRCMAVGETSCVSTLPVGETSRVSMLSVRPTLARDRPSPYGILRSYGPFRHVTAEHL